MADYAAWQLCRLWLSMAEISAAGRRKLLRAFGGEEALFDAWAGGDAPPDAEIGHAARARLCALRESSALERALDAMEQAGVCPLFPELCPAWMGCLPAQPDAPYLLYARGDAHALDRRKLAIVGTRRPSRYGADAALFIARELSLTKAAIVSGLARGIDTQAHTGALQGGGVTIAVLGGGLGSIYPPENEALSRQIVENGGLLLSEYPLGARPDRFRFPLRNRVVAWLSEAVLFVEGTPDSGGTITVDYALQAGIPVFALPGMINTVGASGPHAYIRAEQARLVTCASEMLDDLGWLGYGRQADSEASEETADEADVDGESDDIEGGTADADAAGFDSEFADSDVDSDAGSDTDADSDTDTAPPSVATARARILGALRREPMTFDQLADALALSMPEMEEALILLELDGEISRGAFNEYAAAKPLRR